MTHATPHLPRNIQLKDKYSPGPTRVYLTGIEALIRPPVLQREEVNDVAIALNKAAFLWGRRFAQQPEKILSLLSARQSPSASQGSRLRAAAEP